MKKNWINSNFIFDEILVGQEYLNHDSDTISDVVGKTSNSIEMFNRCNKKNRDKEGKLKGIDSKNWYTLDDFNRKYKSMI
jgi:hypothetical protein